MVRLIDADVLLDIATQQGHVTVDDILSAEAIAPPPNDPLTLDELREMDGDPVWVKSINDDALFSPKGWAIVTALDNGDVLLSFLGEGACRQTWVLSKSGDEEADEEDEIEAVYRRKPEEAAP